MGFRGEREREKVREREGDKWEIDDIIAFLHTERGILLGDPPYTGGMGWWIRRSHKGNNKHVHLLQKGEGRGKRVSQ